jgi:cytoskeletal protein CcmA (bactofilin family)
MRVRKGSALVFHDDERIGSIPDADDFTEDDRAGREWEMPESNWRGLGSLSTERAAVGARSDGPGEPSGTTTVSSGTSLRGTLRSQDPLYIDGEFSGEIFASGDVMIAPGAHVSARVQAIRVTVAGLFEGSVACTDRFEVLETGSIRAQVFAPVFVVHDGATINGEFRMRVGEEDDNDDSGLDGESGVDQT